MWDHKEGLAPKNWCFWTVVLEKTLESPLDSNNIKQVNPKGNQPWIFTGRTGAEAEAPILCPPDAKSWFIRKDPYVGKDWGQQENGVTEDEVVGWHHYSIHVVCASSWRYWRTGKPSVLQFMVSQWVGHDWVTEQQQFYWYMVESPKLHSLLYYLQISYHWTIIYF